MKCLKMKYDLIIDTNVLKDFLVQFYKKDEKAFFNTTFISTEIAKKLNLIHATYSVTGTFSNGVVVASTFAFIELARQFDSIYPNKEISTIQLKAFINQP